MARGKLSFVFSILVMLSLAYFGVNIAYTSLTAPPPIVESEPSEEIEEKPVDNRTPEEKSKWDIDGVIWGLSVDWKALYPARESEEAEEKSFSERIAAFVGAIDESTEAYRAAIADAEGEIETAASENAPHYREIVELANAYDKWLGWEIVDPLSYNPVIEAEEGYFLTCTPRADQSARAQTVFAHASFAENAETPYLFVQLPGKTCRESAASGTTDFYNQNADRLLEKIEKEGIVTLDLREKMHEEGFVHHEQFYKTDHHWLPETGLWAAKTLAQTLNENYGFAADLSLLEKENFEPELYEEWFLGSQGKKVTLARASAEDFALWHPKYDTALRIEIPSLGLDKRGTLAVCYRYGALLNKDLYHENPYGAYLYGDQALVRITNERKEDGRVLILGDSYDNCVVPFFTQAVQRVDTLDLRVFDGSLEAFLAENEYDLIIEMVTK